MKNLVTPINQFRCRIMNNEMTASDLLIMIAICATFSMTTAYIISEPVRLIK